MPGRVQAHVRSYCIHCLNLGSNCSSSDSSRAGESRGHSTRKSKIPCVRWSDRPAHPEQHSTKVKHVHSRYCLISGLARLVLDVAITFVLARSAHVSHVAILDGAKRRENGPDVFLSEVTMDACQI